jgi:hypothetical protein
LDAISSDFKQEVSDPEMITPALSKSGDTTTLTWLKVKL